jgi:hypothetical protein
MEKKEGIPFQKGTQNIVKSGGTSEETKMTINKSQEEMKENTTRADNRDDDDCKVLHLDWERQRQQWLNVH